MSVTIYDRLIAAKTQAGFTIRINEIPKNAKVLSLDIEHDENGGFVCVGLYDGVSNCVYSIFELDLCRQFDFHSVDLITHNGVSDLSVLKTWGLNVPSVPYFDTQLVGHILDSSLKTYGLKDMAKRELGIEYPEYTEIVGKHKGKTKKSPACPKILSDCCGRLTLNKHAQDLVSVYNALDCYSTYKLYEKFKAESERYKAYYKDFEQPLAIVLDKMESRGIRINRTYLEMLQKELESQQMPLKDNIKNELGDINLNSPKQLLAALRSKGISPILKGKPSTDKRALQAFQSERVISQLLKFSELDTLLSSFVFPYLQRQTTYVHPFFNQTGTRTGRLSCSNPNLLQIPKRTENGKKVRRMFIPRPEFILGDSDYGQIEPRLLAHLSLDPALLGMFQSGIDFHTFTAEKLRISRDKAKVLNLSVGYRATFKSVAYQLGCSEADAQAEIDSWWSLFPVLRRWQDKLIWETKRAGYITTLLGRRIKVDNLNVSNRWQRESAERQLINNIAQASAREVMAKAMIKIDSDARLSKSFGLLIQVYDELVYESLDIEQDTQFVVDNMVNAVKLEVPLEVESKAGDNWGDVK